MKTGEALSTGLIQSIKYVIYICDQITCRTLIYACASQIYLLVGELFKEQGQPYESDIPTDDRIS